MNPKLVEEVALDVVALIAREVPCGQSPEGPDDHPCKVTWLPYKRRCPECSLHHTQRADFAKEIAEKVIPRCMARAAEIVHPWQNPAHAQLHAGEMAAQEKRTVTAVAIAIESAIKREGGLT